LVEPFATILGAVATDNAADGIGENEPVEGGIGEGTAGEVGIGGATDGVGGAGETGVVAEGSAGAVGVAGASGGAGVADGTAGGTGRAGTDVGTGGTWKGMGSDDVTAGTGMIDTDKNGLPARPELDNPGADNGALGNVVKGKSGAAGWNNGVSDGTPGVATP
jgi:hypothetical protein